MRYVHDTLARIPNTDAAIMSLTTLNGLHPSLSFKMELSDDNRIPSIGIEIIKSGTKLELKSIESQPILACSYSSIVILINAIKILY